MPQESPYHFIDRHIGPDANELQQMLSQIGCSDVGALLQQTLPAELPSAPPLEIAASASEEALKKRVKTLAAQNKAGKSLIGMGYVGSHMPPPIRRHLLENAGWYTAYTPYQAEISQGRLEMLLLFQQLVQDLSGLPVANASLLDEASAAAEAVMMARRISRHKSSTLLLDHDCHPQVKTILHTRMATLQIAIKYATLDEMASQDCFAAYVSYPGSTGSITALHKLSDALHQQRRLLLVGADPLALLLLQPPGQQGADIVTGSLQSFGLPMGLGGPHAAYIACREAFKRQLPGRLIGVSRDRHGAAALRMALQTREQHIRRDKATSNICTAQVLPALLACGYALYHGAQGLRAIANAIHQRSCRLAMAARQAGWQLPQYFFNTLLLHRPGAAEQLCQQAQQGDFLLRRIDADHCALTLDETVDEDCLQQLAATLGWTVPEQATETLPPSLKRPRNYLQHEHFLRYRSETELMRYLRRLQDLDLALDRGMIPLGSCTMKLNPVTAMETLQNEGLTDVHPYTPMARLAGYRSLLDELCQQLRAVTGFAAISLQPNAGSQGEYAGLLAIRRYHHQHGDSQRNICLIPESAHGTNPASAVMAGFRVVLIRCRDNGDIDLSDLDAQIAQHRAQLAALMLTYPSTHGVFEATILDISRRIHDAGGQVYFDGANLNAMMGLLRPADLGVDVGHLNLHKTFAIPHGGGGPGMGPIGVKQHLMPYLPGDPLQPDSGAIAATAFGSAAILPISWAYISLLGGKGLKRCSEWAIVNANYIATALQDCYPLLFSSRYGRVAHECVLDCRPFVASAGIQAEDIAKRLIDYGFHAPTMAWPVAGCLMVEPTESENRRELDRFIRAMRSIHAEIEKIAQGLWPRQDNPLVQAPHTAAEISMESWSHPYSRRQAAFPLPDMERHKYWPPVARVDQVYGDRHLQCSCPPLEQYR